MAHVSKDIVAGHNGPIPTFDNETCKYLMDIMFELASMFSRGEKFTFSTSVGRIIFEIG